MEECHQQPVTSNCGDIRYPKPSVINVTDMNFVPTLTMEQCCKLEEATRDQADCSMWAQERKHRLTSSQFGLIMKRKKVTEKFIDMLKNPKPFTAKATSYGSANERKALTEYCAKKGYHVHKCGLIVNPKFSFLGASPDSKVCVGDGQSGLVEVKCPFSARDKTIIDACEIRDFCLAQVDGQVLLKKNHNYFYQVQGQLLISGAEFCDFVVYTKKDLFTQRITTDTEFCQNMVQCLYRFYCKYIKD